MHPSAQGRPRPPFVFRVNSVRSFVEAAKGVSGLPSGTSMVAFHLRQRLSDQPGCRPFALALHALANLAASTPMISLCHIEGQCTGTALALALRCDVVAVSPSASLSCAWSDPAAAAVHFNGSERVGAVACERLLFDQACGAPHAAEQGIASFICEDFEAALTRCLMRMSTIHATARAFRLAWPFLMDTADALSEPFAGLR